MDLSNVSYELKDYSLEEVHLGCFADFSWEH